MARKMLWVVLVIGVCMVIAPFALGLPGKASGGQRMLDDFRPLMQQANVDKTASYYNDVFVPLGAVAPAVNDESMAKFAAYMQGMSAMQADAQKLVPMLAQAMNMTPEQVQAVMADQFPAMTQMLANFPQMQQDFNGMIGLMSDNTAIFGQVPAGLAHYQPLVTTMQANVDNYREVDSLPSFRLFTWFFVVPGILLVVVALFGLFFHRRPDEAPVAVETPTPERQLSSV